MERKNTLVGVILILFGVSLYLKNFNISTSDAFVLFLGLFLLYLYQTKKQQPFLIFGGIFTVIGTLSILDDLRLFRNDLNFEVFLIIAGMIFVYFYFQRGIRGFVYPGFILPALGTYLIIESIFGKRQVEPAFYILLGIAFYFIYFAAHWGGSRWPLIAGTLFVTLGILMFAIRLGLIAFSIWDYSAYFLPVLLVLVGLGILLKNIKRNEGKN